MMQPKAFPSKGGTAPNTSVTKEEKNPSTSIQLWQRIYHLFGFQKGYNFTLCQSPCSHLSYQPTILTSSDFIFAGALLGFTLARLSYLNISGTASSSFANGALPGEWYWMNQGIYRIGITIHLATILPAGLLIVLQVTPVIRHKYLIVHRINGYIIIVLVFVSNVGAVMICRRSFGGTIPTQAAVGLLAIISSSAIGMAYYNIKRLQVDQHRAWMLRAMFYLGTIITLRIIMIISALVSSQMSNYYTTMSCRELGSIQDLTKPFRELYPRCGQDVSTNDTLVVVQGTFGNGQPEQIAASLRVSFGMAMWMAILLHVVGVEIYLGLTPRESNWLRQVSYERQMEKGLKPFGSAGLTTDRWGDAEPWKPAGGVAVDGSEIL